jgi:hypothetical protein
MVAAARVEITQRERTDEIDAHEIAGKECLKLGAKVVKDDVDVGKRCGSYALVHRDASLSNWFGVTDSLPGAGGVILSFGSQSHLLSAPVRGHAPDIDIRKVSTSERKSLRTGSSSSTR